MAYNQNHAPECLDFQSVVSTCIECLQILDDLAQKRRILRSKITNILVSFRVEYGFYPALQAFFPNMKALKSEVMNLANKMHVYYFNVTPNVAKIMKMVEGYDRNANAKDRYLNFCFAIVEFQIWMVNEI